mgnify:CR=1 FL=1
MNLDIESLTVDAVGRARVAAHEDRERTYLGASIIGDPCWRKLWYLFRWAYEPEKFDARMLRLFETGHIEEARIVADLRASGVSIWDLDPKTGEQWAISDIGGHFCGHTDGVGKRIHEAPKEPHLLECKSHNDDSFRQLLKLCVEKAKPVHYAQMQIYMHYMRLSRALYYAVNKNDDAEYSERVPYDQICAARLISKARTIITVERPPQKLHSDPNAKMARIDCACCSVREGCHEGTWARRNCRTCLHSTPMLDGDARWHCERHDHDLTREDQEVGCSAHLYIPELVPGEQIDADPVAEWVDYVIADGVIWRDGAEATPNS